MGDDLLRDFRHAVEGFAEAEDAGEGRQESVEHLEIGFEPAQPGAVGCIDRFASRHVGTGGSLPHARQYCHPGLLD